MDRLGDAGQDLQETAPAPQGCGSTGSAVGNGVCHGQPRPCAPDPTPLPKTGEEAEGGGGPWASPMVGVETCGALKEDRQGEQEEEGGSPGRGEQGEKEAELHLKEPFDAGMREMSNESDFSSPSLPSGVSAGCGEGEHMEAWRLSGEREKPADVERPTLLSGDPIPEEEEGGFQPGNLGQERSEDPDGDEDEEEEEGDNEDRDRRGEDGREWRAGGYPGPRRPGGGGKRGRGRGGEQAPAPPGYSRGPPSAGGRHKQARRRNHHHHHHHHQQQGRGRGLAGSRAAAAACRELLAGSLRPWCLSYLRMLVELIVLVAHRCGEAVEAGGAALYTSGSLLLRRARDLPVLKAEARRLAGRLSGLFRRAAAACLSRLRWAAVLGTAGARAVLTGLGGERGRRWWVAFRDSGAWKQAAALWEKVAGVFRGRGQHAPPSGAGRASPGQELERLLELSQIPEDQLDPFAVLGVEASASDTELKRAYRQLAVQVHPDKNKHPRAGEAFKVLRAAWGVVSNPETRREYELKRMAETELSKSMNEFLIKLQDDLKEAMNTMMCTKCEGKHKRFEMERDPSEARFCAECNRRHGAEEGDFWAESSLLGLRITYFAFMDGKVYDITEWAGCQRIVISPDTHRVPYHISFGSKNNGSATRHRAPPEPPPGPGCPPDLQDFFNRIFHGGVPNGMASNGGFFPTGAPPHHHHHAPRPGPGPSTGPGGPFSPPPPHAGFFGAGGQRPDPAEPRTEAAKPPPRRRKKVRKPFQR